jgi:hypothetical protein
MNLQQIATSRKESLLKEKQKLEKLLRKAPDGSLIYSRTIIKNKSYYKWYVSTPSGRKYISRQNRNLARELARKKLRQQQLKDINSELKAIDLYLKNHSNYSDLAKLLESPPILNLLMEENPAPVNDLSEELEKWANEPYEMNPKYPEHKTIRAINGLMVRSKSEAFIVMLLVTHHIPFRYECKLELNGQTIYPDFTIRHPVTGETYYWEHAGRLEDPNYISKHIYTMRFFLNNGLIPDFNVIFTYESDSHPFNIQIAEDKLKEFFSLDGKLLY